MGADPSQTFPDLPIQDPFQDSLDKYAMLWVSVAGIQETGSASLFGSLHA